MSRPSAIVLVFTAVLSIAAHRTAALEIDTFDKMSVADQTRYVRLLLDGTKKFMEAQGKPDAARTIVTLFDTTQPGALKPVGMAHFGTNLTFAKQNQQKRGSTLHVEDALLLTYQDLGIDMARADLVRIGQAFRPAQ